MTNLFIPGNDNLNFSSNYMYQMEKNDDSNNELEKAKMHKLSSQQQATKSRKPLPVLINSIIQYNYDIMNDEMSAFHDKYRY